MNTQRGATHHAIPGFGTLVGPPYGHEGPLSVGGVGVLSGKTSLAAGAHVVPDRGGTS